MSSVKFAADLRDSLKDLGCRIVFAESCTAGRLSTRLAELPGISETLCGSFVVYRLDSKTRWLGIPRSLLDDPAYGPVSPEVTRLLAAAALDRTPEANVAVAVTGDVGPNAPQATDGIVYSALRFRGSAPAHEHTFRLTSPAPMGPTDFQSRINRLDEASSLIFAWATGVLKSLDIMSLDLSGPSSDTSD
jgi:PncC family amidohydrolase